MVVNRKPTGIASSVPAGLAQGWMVFLAMILAGSAGVAALVSMEKMAENHLGYGIMVVLLLASWLGAVVSRKKIKRQNLPVCLASGGIGLASLLLITGLFFGGQYTAVGETSLLICCGSLLAAMGGKTRKTKGAQRKFRIPNG